MECTQFVSSNESFTGQPEGFSQQIQLSDDDINGLLNNLANGVGIFKVSADGELRLQFCGGRLAELLGTSMEQFFAEMCRLKGYGIHPDDLDKGRKVIKELLESGKSVSNTFRFLCKNGDYRHISVFSNVSREKDGGYKLYCIFSDAEETERLRRVEKERQRHLEKKWLQTAEKRIAYIALDITNNLCIESYHEHESLSNKGAATVFLEELENIIASDEYREEFVRRFSFGTYIEDVKNAVFSKDMCLPLLQEKLGVHWYRLSADTIFDSSSRIVETFLRFIDIDNEVRLSYTLDRLLEKNFEYICQIDVSHGHITKIGSSKQSDILSGISGYVRYADVYRQLINEKLPQEYWEEAYTAFSIETIISQLEHNSSYSCLFPVVANGTVDEHICHWSFEYVDPMRSTIQLCRKNISSVLNYGMDPLTALYNRDGFYRNVRTELTNNPDERCYICELDFANFELLNDLHGYDSGNKLLCRFATDIRYEIIKLSRRCLVGHLETDFFAFLIPESVLSPERLYEMIVSLLSSYDNTERLTPRIGVYKIQNPELDIAFMCECAHLANRMCKRQFNKNIGYYAVAMREKMLNEQLLDSEMRNALHTEQFKVWFQPQVDHSKNGLVVGAEALVRWQHPKYGMISPAVFIPLFEQNGFIYELDKYVWAHACMNIRYWIDRGLDPLPISVNISRVDIQQQDFVQSLLAIVREKSVPYELLHLEITESSFSANPTQAIEVINELLKLGFTVAIDDFGSGFSSLSMLKSVPVQILKLDMRFFNEEGELSRNKCIIESVVNMAKTLGMTVIAEGVESIEQANYLNKIGCSIIQGYLYSTPMPCSEYVKHMYKSNRHIIKDESSKASG